MNQKSCVLHLAPVLLQAQFSIQPDIHELQQRTKGVLHCQAACLPGPNLSKMTMSKDRAVTACGVNSASLLFVDEGFNIVTLAIAPADRVAVLEWLTSNCLQAVAADNPQFLPQKLRKSLVCQYEALSSIVKYQGMMVVTPGERPDLESPSQADVPFPFVWH